MSQTRWHGYLDAMLRHLELEQRINDWLEDTSDENLNKDKIEDTRLDSYERGQVSAIIYVLAAIRPYDSFV